MNTFQQMYNDAGLQIVGEYSNGQFRIERPWLRKPAVYVWALPEPEGLRPVRVGKACGKGGLGGRHSLHNRWLSGRFKPENRREQAFAALTRHRLGRRTIILALAVKDDPEGKRIERDLVQKWAPLLDLDLTLPASWAKLEMIRSLAA